MLFYKLYVTSGSRCANWLSLHVEINPEVLIKNKAENEDDRTNEYKLFNYATYDDFKKMPNESAYELGSLGILTII